MSHVNAKKQSRANAKQPSVFLFVWYLICKVKLIFVFNFCFFFSEINEPGRVGMTRFVVNLAKCEFSFDF